MSNNLCKNLTKFAVNFSTCPLNFPRRLEVQSSFSTMSVHRVGTSEKSRLGIDL